MRARLVVFVVLAALVAAPAAGAAARLIGYQGWSSQGREISFKFGKKGVSVMKVAFVTTCSTGPVLFTVRATDTVADPLSRKRRFKTVLESPGAPPVTVVGKFNKYGVARGTLTASGPGKGQQGEDFGACATDSPVRWTAAPR
jgi:hypothetical protein